MVHQVLLNEIKKNILFIFLLFFFEKYFSQINLIPNYSFEQFSTCPNNFSTNIYYANFWQNATITGTSDYYNSCVVNSPYYFDVPQNFIGFEYAKTGTAYGGFILSGSNFSSSLEYIQTKLLDSLNPNYNYCVQYFVSRADSLGDYGISNFGALFTNTLVNSSDPYNIQMAPQVKNPTGNIIMGKIGWTPISGTYTAIGGEKYITIGNFDPKSAIDTIFDPVHPNNPSGFYEKIYYYIDDVTVEEVANAKAGRDSIINCGDSLAIGADSAIGAYYKWTPNIGLSNDSIAFPIANPTITTTYVLQKKQCHIVTYDTVKITVNGICPVIGINELSNTYHFKLYPNPSNEIFTIEMNIGSNEQCSISIYNLLGELVKHQSLKNGNTKVDVSALNSGTYFYSIKINDTLIKNDKLIIIK